ncbi:hypothetical protein N7490_010834 [Penicillium lividum]|nr:hypothetical protein N7490_010834 [Penicillium lividum]
MSTIAFFGPTGGCANACLAHTLINGYKAIALARTPAKLTAQLLEQPGLTTDILNKQLRIVQGDGLDVEAVMKTLIVSESGSMEHDKPVGTSQPTLVNMIVSGMGGTGTIVFTKPCDRIGMRVPTIPHVSLTNPHITEQFTATLLTALRRIAETFGSYTDYAAVAPRLLVISTTGIKEGLNDVPFWFKKMYEVLLPIPHEDKKQMEKLLDRERVQKESLLAKGLIYVRPSLLVGDHKIAVPGVDDRYGKLRVGTEKKPAVGYTVPRIWIGRWVFEEVVKSGGDTWVGEGVILTA